MPRPFTFTRRSNGPNQAIDATHVNELQDAIEQIDATGPTVSTVTVKNQGVALSTAGTTLNFTGAGVTASGTTTEKTITIPSAAVGGLPWATGDSIGLVGDNSTDNSAALQAWHDGLATTGNARGGTLVVKPGIYRFASAVNLTKSGIAIVGAGAMSTQLSGANPSYGTQFVAVTAGMKLLNVDPGSTLNHLGPRIEGINFYDNVGSSCTAIYVHLTNRWRINDCGFGGFSKAIHLWSDALTEGGAISGGDCAWGMIRDVYIKGGVHGVYSQHSFGFTMVGGEVDGLTAAGVYFAVPGAGSNGTAHCRLLGVKFDANLVGIELNGSYNEIIGCNFEVRAFNNAYGIRVGNGFQSRQNSIVGNAFIGSGSVTGETGIHLDANAFTTLAPNYVIANTYQTIDTAISEHASVAGLNHIEGYLPNAGRYGLQLPDSASTPATGTVGQIIRVGGNVYRASAANTWTAM